MDETLPLPAETPKDKFAPGIVIMEVGHHIAVCTPFDVSEDERELVFDWIMQMPVFLRQKLHDAWRLAELIGE